MLCYILAVALTPWCEKATSKASPPKSFLFFLIAVVNISPQSLTAQVKPQDLTKNPHRYSHTLILFTLTGFLFFDLSIQNRHFLSSLSVHFASIGIGVVSMFWVISSSVLYNPLPDLQTHWPLSSLREISAAKQFRSFTRTSFFPGVNGREPRNDQVSWVNNTFVFINRKVEPHVTPPGRSQSNMVKAKSPHSALNCWGGRTF